MRTKIDSQGAPLKKRGSERLYHERSPYCEKYAGIAADGTGQTSGKTADGLRAMIEDQMKDFRAHMPDSGMIPDLS